MKKGKRISRKEPKKRLTAEEIAKKKKRIIKTFLTIVIIIVLGIIALIANNFIILDKNKNTNLVINNKNVTSNLKKNIIIENGTIYLSEPDIANFFDKHIYEDEKINKVITTYEKKIATIGFEENEIEINGSNKNIYAHAIKKDNVTYLPISEMADVYNVEIANIDNTKVVTMDSLDREQKRAIVNSSVSVKSTTNFIAKTVDRIKKGDCVIVVSSE